MGVEGLGLRVESLQWEGSPLNQGLEKRIGEGSQLAKREGERGRGMEGEGVGGGGGGSHRARLTKSSSYSTSETESGLGLGFRVLGLGFRAACSGFGVPGAYPLALLARSRPHSGLGPRV